jgi:signal peptidase II
MSEEIRDHTRAGGLPADAVDRPPRSAGTAGSPDAWGDEARPPRGLVYLVWAMVAGIWLVLDQATKLLAVAALAERSVDLGVLDLRLVRNPGGAFGIPGFPGLFILVTVVVLTLVARALPRTERLSQATAFGLLTGGALGNVVDRIARAPGFPSGHVVDFVDLRWWPVFNLADVGIVVGAASLFVLLQAAERDRARPPAAQAAPQSGADSPQPGPGVGQGPGHDLDAVPPGR